MANALQTPQLAHFSLPAIVNEPMVKQANEGDTRRERGIDTLSETLLAWLGGASETPAGAQGDALSRYPGSTCCDQWREGNAKRQKNSFFCSC